MIHKEVILILLDVGNSMYQPHPNILYQPKAEIGLHLIGSDQSTSGKDGIFDIHDIQPPDFQFLRNLSLLTDHDVPQTNGSDLFYSIEQAMIALQEHADKSPKTTWTKKIYILSNGNGDSKYLHPNSLHSIVKAVKETNTKINFIAIDFCKSLDDDEEGSIIFADEPEFENDPKQTIIQNRNQKLLMQFVDQCEGNAMILTSTQAFQILKRLKAKTVFPRCKLKINFEISPMIKIGVEFYSKISLQNLPTLKKYSLMCNFDKDEKTNGIENTKKYYRQDDPECRKIPSERQVKAYKYGKQLVQILFIYFKKVNIPKIVEDSLKFQSVKSFKLLGFVDKDKVPRYYYLGIADLILASGKSLEDQQALNAIIRAMIELNKIAFARLCQREHTAPKLVALIPHITEKYAGLFSIQLPTAEDIREFSFKSLNSSSIEQEKAAAQLIDNMNLTNQKMSDGSEQEIVKLNETYNPVLNMLKELDPVINNLAHPENIIRENCKEALETFAKSFKLKEMPLAEKFWTEMLTGKATLESQTLITEDMEPEILIDESEQLVSTKKFNFDEDIDKKVKHISQTRPVQDFEAMINNKTEDLVETAVSQMKQIILTAIQVTINGSLNQKIIDCLVALRNGCIREDEALVFNDFIKEIKKIVLIQNMKFLWQQIVDKKITLITNEENKESSVNQEISDEFLIAELIEVEHNQDFHNAPSQQNNLLDEIE